MFLLFFLFQFVIPTKEESQLIKLIMEIEKKMHINLQQQL